MKKIILMALILMALSAFASETTAKKFPDFTLKNLANQDVKLADLLAEKPVVVTFWATYCKPCLKELKAFKPIFEELKDDIHFVAINEDGPRSKSKIKPLVKKEGFDYTVLYDKGAKLKLKAGVVDIPHFFLLDQNGEIVFSHRGYKSGDEKKSTEAIKALIKEIKAAGETLEQ